MKVHHVILLLALVSTAAAQGKGKGKGNQEQPGDQKQSANQTHSGSHAGAPVLNETWRVLSRDQQNRINDCYTSGRAGLPPGLAKKEKLPPGLQRQLRKKGKLPPGLQKKVQPLDAACQTGLPPLPADWSRVIVHDRVLLLDPAKRIIDWANIVLGRTTR